MIAVIDYGRGNLFSISQALSYLGVEHAITSDPDEIGKAKKIIFPGVGAFGDAMTGLREQGLVEPLLDAADQKKPFLGICVGCQLLLARGEEFGSHEGLGIIPGAVTRLPDPRPGAASHVRIPNVGWRRLSRISDTPVLNALHLSDYVYFVHSFAPRPDNPDSVVATLLLNDKEVPVAIAADNILGVQFHPEKSGAAGLRFLKEFATGRDILNKPQERI